MQGRHLHRIGLVFLAALQHRDQRHVLHQIEERHVVFFGLALEPTGQLQHVLPACLRGAFLEQFEQMAFVLNGFHQVVQDDAGGFGRRGVLARGAASGAPLHAADEFGKGAQGFQLARRQQAFQSGLGHGGKQRCLARGRVLAQHLQRGLADATLGRGGRADERGVVIVIGQQAQVRQDVAHFRLVEEALPARDRVRNLQVAQRLLQNARLMVAAVQDGEVLPLRLALEARGRHLHRDGFRLLFFAVHGRHQDGFAHAQIRPQLFFEQLGILLDHLVGGGQDALYGTVVLFQFDQLDVGIVGGQLGQVLDGGAAPGINGLIVVAHRREHGARPRQQLHQPVLAHVGVLVFVHQQIAHAVLPAGADVLVAGQQLRGDADQVVEVHGLIGGQRGGIAAVDIRGLDVARRDGFAGGVIRFHQPVLPERDDALHVPQAGLVGGGQQFLDDRHGVVGVQNRERGLQAGIARLFAQHLHAQRMEGADDQALGQLAVDQGLHALVHLSGGLVGEGQRHHVAPHVAAFAQQIRDLLRDHARLAAAGAGQHQARAVQVKRRFPLSGIHA
ncbi:hypothetical protein D3C71_464850 [compost metagenome]